MKRLPTNFASAERDPIDTECELHQRLAGELLLQPLLNSFPGPALIMNQHRQAVLVNDKLAALVNMPAIELLGLRPGEMLDCIRWRLEPWGCGTVRVHTAPPFYVLRKSKAGCESKSTAGFSRRTR